MRFTALVQFFVVLCSSLNILCSTINVSRNEVLVPDFTNLLRLDGRIVNGTKATLGQFPHQVSLRKSFSGLHFCGGSAIDDHWILTAAHCMYKQNGDQIAPWTISVVSGQVRLDEPTTYTQKHAVEAIIVHENFEGTTLTNDIALLKLETQLDFSTDYVKAAALETAMPEPGTVCKISGWGFLSEDAPVASNYLMYVALPIIKPTRCRELLATVTNLPLGMFCAGYEEGQRDACQGDSGGGMICGDTLVGVVSGGEGCARPTFPGLYSDVPYYRNWIKYNMKNYNATAHSYIEAISMSKMDSLRNTSPNVYVTLSFRSLSVAYTLFSFLSLKVSNWL